MNDFNFERDFMIPWIISPNDRRISRSRSHRKKASKVHPLSLPPDEDNIRKEKMLSDAFVSFKHDPESSISDNIPNIVTKLQAYCQERSLHCSSCFDDKPDLSSTMREGEL